MPSAYEELYYALIDDEVYSAEELEYLRECYGDHVIYEVYVEEFGPFYTHTKDGAIVTTVSDK